MPRDFRHVDVGMEVWGGSAEVLNAKWSSIALRHCGISASRYRHYYYYTASSSQLASRKTKMSGVGNDSLGILEVKEMKGRPRQVEARELLERLRDQVSILNPTPCTGYINNVYCPIARRKHKHATSSLVRSTWRVAESVHSLAAYYFPSCPQ